MRRLLGIVIAACIIAGCTAAPAPVGSTGATTLPSTVPSAPARGVCVVRVLEPEGVDGNATCRFVHVEVIDLGWRSNATVAAWACPPNDTCTGEATQRTQRTVAAPAGNLTQLHADLSWNPVSPLTNQLVFDVRAYACGGCDPVFHARLVGASPLRVDASPNVSVAGSAALMVTVQGVGGPESDGTVSVMPGQAFQVTGNATVQYPATSQWVLVHDPK